MTTQLASPQRRWPRTFLLEILNRAISQGSCEVYPISVEDAASLRASLHRIRRRSDKSHASFITPEMHLVTIGVWHTQNNGTLPIYYTNVPASEPPLPSISGPIPDSSASYPGLQKTAIDIPALSDSVPLQEPLDPAAIDDYVEGLKKGL
jgi:hypothetical protein